MKVDIVIQAIDRLISVAQEVQYQRMEGPQQLYEEALDDLEKAKAFLLEAVC